MPEGLQLLFSTVGFLSHAYPRFAANAAHLVILRNRLSPLLRRVVRNRHNPLYNRLWWNPSVRRPAHRAQHPEHLLPVGLVQGQRTHLGAGVGCLKDAHVHQEGLARLL